MGFLLHNDILNNGSFVIGIWEVSFYQCRDPKVSPQTEESEFFVKMNAHKSFYTIKPPYPTKRHLLLKDFSTQANNEGTMW